MRRRREKRISEILGYLGIVVLAFVAAAVDHRFGPIGVVRLFGVAFAMTTGYMTFVSEVPFYIGRRLAATFTGWKKAFVVVPCVGLGLVFFFYAPELTCIASEYKHLCA